MQFVSVYLSASVNLCNAVPPAADKIQRVFILLFTTGRKANNNVRRSLWMRAAAPLLW
jgi:hypothetical protein